MVSEIAGCGLHIVGQQRLTDVVDVTRLDSIEHFAVNLLLIAHHIFALAGAAVKDDGVAAVHAAPQKIQSL